MNVLGTVGQLGGGNLTCLGNRKQPPGSQSLPKALNNLFSSVKKMQDTVMVPSRLKDIKYDPYQMDPMLNGGRNNTSSGPASLNSYPSIGKKLQWTKVCDEPEQ